MATLEVELVELKQRIERLESAVYQVIARRPQASSDPSIEQDGLMGWLKAEGLVRDPTPEEQRLANEWEDLSEEGKQTVQWELDHLPPGPLVSDIIIENRR